MLDLILSYIFSMLTSFIVDFLSIKEFIKIIFDNGYKLSSTNNKLGLQINKTQKIIRFIPLINIINSLMIYADIRNNKHKIIDIVYNWLEEMKNEEKEIYNKKTNFSRAILIQINSKKNSKITRFKDGSYIDNEIHINPISKLKNEKQKKLIFEEIQNIDEDSELKDMFIEKRIIPKKTNVILKLKELKANIEKRIAELENDKQKDKEVNKTKIKKL